MASTLQLYEGTAQGCRSVPVKAWLQYRCIEVYKRKIGSNKFANNKVLCCENLVCSTGIWWQKQFDDKSTLSSICYCVWCHWQQSAHDKVTLSCALNLPSFVICMCTYLSTCMRCVFLTLTWTGAMQFTKYICALWKFRGCIAPHSKTFYRGSLQLSHYANGTPTLCFCMEKQLSIGINICKN